MYATTDPTRELWRFQRAGIIRRVVAREMGERLEIRIAQAATTVEKRTFGTLHATKSKGHGWKRPPDWPDLPNPTRASECQYGDTFAIVTKPENRP